MTRIMVPTTGARRYNDHLHIDFFLGAFERAGFEVVLYGPEAERRGRVPIPFDPKRPIGEVARELDPDIYFTLAPKKSQWASHHRIPLDIPKIIYHCDLHYAEDGRHYRNAQLLVVRARAHLEHLRSLRNPTRVPARWLPFSVDATRVPSHQPSSIQRAARVFFAGAAKPEPYPLRAAAIAELDSAGLLFRAGVRGFDAYMAELARFPLGVTCSSRWRLDVAKHLEIAAAGALVMTDGLAEGLSHLYPEREMYAIYRNGRDAVRRTGKLLSNRVELAGRAGLARDHVLKHHDDVTRGRELVAIMAEAGCC